MDKYNIGQRLVVNEDIETKTFISESKYKFKKGTRMYVGADKFIHFLDTSVIPTNAEIEGYSVIGISEFIYEMMSRTIPLDDMLEDYDLEPVELKIKIADALEELGFYDDAGNRS